MSFLKTESLQSLCDGLLADDIYLAMDVSDPLRTLDNDESEDLFKAAFNGSSAGVIKITTSHSNDDHQEGLHSSLLLLIKALNNLKGIFEEIFSIKMFSSFFLIVEKCDVPKPVTDEEEVDEDDLFSDCRSDVGSEADRRSSFNKPSPTPSSRPPVSSSVEAGIREKLNIGRADVTEDEAAAQYLHVSVSDPHKVGDGISSYMAYKVLTRTNLHCFRRKSFSVIRRYSDFLGLHEKLVVRYQSKGRIIPPPPEKSIIGEDNL